MPILSYSKTEVQALHMEARHAFPVSLVVTHIVSQTSPRLPVSSRTRVLS